jgi:hypothetical protein
MRIFMLTPRSVLSRKRNILYKICREKSKHTPYVQQLVQKKRNIQHIALNRDNDVSTSET